MRIIPYLIPVLALTAACGDSAASGAGAAGPGRGGRGATVVGVGIVALQPQQIEDGSEFIATVQSLHSTTVQPQVEGVLTKIFIRSGDVVRAGTPLAQIDPERQAQTLHTTESTRAAREADVTYWKSQVERLQSLLKAGAISQNEFDTARHELDTAQANLSALDAQVREGRVQLDYYRVVAPTAGVIGDVPVREGDRVTTSTVLTTIDDKAGLEAYIEVPVDRAPDLRVGLPVQLLDQDGKVIASNPLTFVAPRVDPATQTVLAKSRLHDAPPSVRVQQFVRTRIIWRSLPGLLIPITAVTRVNGQYFAYVAEPSGQGLIAHQRPVEVGEVQGNNYVVKGGLKPGDQLIVSGIQKIADGVPVKAQ